MYSHFNLPVSSPAGGCRLNRVADEWCPLTGSTAASCSSPDGAGTQNANPVLSMQITTRQLPGERRGVAAPSRTKARRRAPTSYYILQRFWAPWNQESQGCNKISTKSNANTAYLNMNEWKWLLLMFLKKCIYFKTLTFYFKYLLLYENALILKVIEYNWFFSRIFRVFSFNSDIGAICCRLCCKMYHLVWKTD